MTDNKEDDGDVAAKRSAKRQRIEQGVFEVKDFVDSDLVSTMKELDDQRTHAKSQLKAAQTVLTNVQMAMHIAEVIDKIKSTPDTFVALLSGHDVTKRIVNAMDDAAKKELTACIKAEKQGMCKRTPITEPVVPKTTPYVVGWARVELQFGCDKRLDNEWGPPRDLLLGFNLYAEANAPEDYDKTKGPLMMTFGIKLATDSWTDGPYDDSFFAVVDPEEDIEDDTQYKDVDMSILKRQLEEDKRTWTIPEDNDEGDHKGRDARGWTHRNVILVAWKKKDEE
jgi:hypothetical protein